MVAMAGCAASPVAVGGQSSKPLRSYPNAREPMVTVARYHDLKAGQQIATLLAERGTPATVAGSEEGVVLAEACKAANIRAIIAEAIAREHLNATITER